MNVLRSALAASRQTTKPTHAVSSSRDGPAGGGSRSRQSSRDIISDLYGLEPDSNQDDGGFHAGTDDDDQHRTVPRDAESVARDLDMSLGEATRMEAGRGTLHGGGSPFRREIQSGQGSIVSPARSGNALDPWLVPDTPAYRALLRVSGRD